MPTTIPIACSLDQAELPERGAQMAQLGQTPDRGPRRGPDARACASRSTERAEVEAFVAAESACCPFFGFEQTTRGRRARARRHRPRGRRMGRARPGRRLRRRLGRPRMSEATERRAARARTSWRARLAAPALAGLAVLCCLGAPLIVGALGLADDRRRLRHRRRRPRAARALPVGGTTPDDGSGC